MKDKILILGSSGYIGSNLSFYLKKNNIAYSGLGRSLNEYNDYGIDLLSVDISTLVKIFINYNTVIGLSWYVNHTDYKMSNLNTIWSSAYINKILPALNRAKVNHFIGVGSCLEYGCSLSGPINSSTSANPNTIYGACKLNAFNEYSHKFVGMYFSWLRLFYVYGGNENSKKLIPSIRKSINTNQLLQFDNPYIVNDYVHVEHVIKCIIKVINEKSVGILNIGSGLPVMNCDIYDIIKNNIKVSSYDKLNVGHYCDDIYIKDDKDM
ncbi:NAD-dependent epimerase/dehydratase family protein, partial [Opitutales bacterium]|nr:NAD-dependent epimerase/dehydratase family protein [Opitutales bacterium]